MNDKDRFDSLFKLMEFWWGRFEARRQSYWRLSILIWSVLVFWMYLILSEAVRVRWQLSALSIESVALCAIAVGAHFGFVLLYAKANRVDKGKANTLHDQLVKLVDIEYSEEVTDSVKRMTDRLNSSRVYWTDLHWLITVGLGLLMLLLTSFYRSGETESDQSEPQQIFNTVLHNGQMRPDSEGSVGLQRTGAVPVPSPDPGDGR